MVFECNYTEKYKFHMSLVLLWTDLSFCWWWIFCLSDVAIQRIVLEATWFKNSRSICAYISSNALREVDTSVIVAEILSSPTTGLFSIWSFISVWLRFLLLDKLLINTSGIWILWNYLLLFLFWHGEVFGIGGCDKKWISVYKYIITSLLFTK